MEDNRPIGFAIAIGVKFSLTTFTIFGWATSGNNTSGRDGAFESGFSNFLETRLLVFFLLEYASSTKSHFFEILVDE